MGVSLSREEGITQKRTMLAVSKLAARSISGSILCRSYGKIRELTSTIPGKMPKVCTSEEAVETVKSGDRV